MSNCMEADMTAERTYIDSDIWATRIELDGLLLQDTMEDTRWDTLGHTGLGVYKGLLRAPGHEGANL